MYKVHRQASVHFAQIEKIQENLKAATNLTGVPTVAGPLI
jgi:hypothetical protein